MPLTPPQPPTYPHTHTLGPPGSQGDDTKELAHRIAMHVVGALPRYLDRAAVPQEVLAAERRVLTEQAGKSGEIVGIWVGGCGEGRLAGSDSCRGWKGVAETPLQGVGEQGATII
jgi:hypothetical protein